MIRVARDEPQDMKNAAGSRIRRMAAFFISFRLLLDGDEIISLLAKAVCFGGIEHMHSVARVYAFDEMLLAMVV